MVLLQWTDTILGLTTREILCYGLWKKETPSVFSIHKSTGNFISSSDFCTSCYTSFEADAIDEAEAIDASVCGESDKKFKCSSFTESPRRHVVTEPWFNLTKTAVAAAGSTE